MFQEVKACKLLSNFLESRGWTVKRGVYGLETAFEARIAFVGGGRTVCYNVEYGTSIALVVYNRAISLLLIVTNPIDLSIDLK